MVREGNCSYFDKVRNIENSGGHLAIIISESEEPVSGIFLSEEGLGSDINIPAILISKKDGQKLADYYVRHPTKEGIRDIRLEVQFQNENLDNTVRYDVWYSPDQDSAYSFFKDFKELQKALGEQAILNIHFFTYPHFTYVPNKRVKIENCFGSGLYCTRPGKSNSGNGAEIIRESIRQKCIYKYCFENKNKKKQNSFWNYVDTFYDKCVYEKKIDTSCSESIMKKVGVPVKEIQQCYEESFIGNKKQNDYEYYLKNKFLDKEYELRKKNFISKSPSITINDRVYLGSWRADYVFESLCASLIKKPELCYMEATFERKLKGVSLLAFLLIIGAVIIINIILFLVCKRIIKKGIEERVETTDIDSKIDKAVDSYLALRDSAPGED